MTARRRGPGEGSLYKESGYWVAAVDGGTDPATGRRSRRKVKARTKTEVIRRVADLRRELEEAKGPVDGNVALSAFLEKWLATVVANRVGSDNTLANYSWVVRVHLVPGLGSVPVGRLTPEMVDNFLAGKAETGLARSSVYRIRAVLADALRHAERRDLVRRNAAALSIMPKCKPSRPRRSLTVEEARALLDAARGRGWKAWWPAV